MPLPPFSPAQCWQPQAQIVGLEEVGTAFLRNPSWWPCSRCLKHQALQPGQGSFLSVLSPHLPHAPWLSLPQCSLLLEPIVRLLVDCPLPEGRVFDVAPAVSLALPRCQINSWRGNGVALTPGEPSGPASPTPKVTGEELRGPEVVIIPHPCR